MIFKGEVSRRLTLPDGSLEGGSPPTTLPGSLRGGRWASKARCHRDAMSPGLHVRRAQPGTAQPGTARRRGGGRALPRPAGGPAPDAPGRGAHPRPGAWESPGHSPALGPLSLSPAKGPTEEPGAAGPEPPGETEAGGGCAPSWGVGTGRGLPGCPPPVGKPRGGRAATRGTHLGASGGAAWGRRSWGAGCADGALRPGGCWAVSPGLAPARPRGAVEHRASHGGARATCRLPPGAAAGAGAGEGPAGPARRRCGADALPGLHRAQGAPGTWAPGTCAPTRGHPARGHRHVRTRHVLPGRGGDPFPRPGAPGRAARAPGLGWPG